MPVRSIAICGAGPAGLAAALLLHRDGHRVRLFERFESARPVGSGLLLQPTGLAVLQELGLAEAILLRGSRIHQLQGITVPRGHRALSVRYGAIGPEWCAVGIHRAALFDALHTAVVAAGIPIECGITITPDDHRLKGHDLVVDAMGANSPLWARQESRRSLEYGALWINLPWPGAPFQPDRLDQRYRAASCMAGLMPIGRVDLAREPQAAFFWSLRRGDLADWTRAPFRQWVEKVHGTWPEVAQLLQPVAGHEACTFATYDHFTRRRPYQDRCVHIGDSAHATSPQLGQGANMALLDALALTVALRDAVDLPGALQRYASMRRWHVRLFQWSSAVFTPFYQSDSRLLPLLRDHILAPLTRVPPLDRFVARLVSGMTVAPLSGRTFQPLRVMDAAVSARS
jgi:salicylate hydroxylase